MVRRMPAAKMMPRPSRRCRCHTGPLCIVLAWPHTQDVLTALAAAALLYMITLLLGVQEPKQRPSLGRVKTLFARMKLGKLRPPLKVTTPVASAGEA